MKKRSSLERKMLSYFGLIAAASIFITLQFIYAIHKATPGPEAMQLTPEEVGRTAVQVVGALDWLQKKAILMGVVQAAVTLIVLIMFMRRITGPLQHMVETSRRISDGDLSQTVHVRSRDEIGLLGETINGLTSNIQELVAYGLSTEESIRDSLENLRSDIGGEERIRSSLDEIDMQLVQFRDLMTSFTLFPDPLSAEQGERMP